MWYKWTDGHRLLQRWNTQICIAGSLFSLWLGHREIKLWALPGKKWEKLFLGDQCGLTKGLCSSRGIPKLQIWIFQRNKNVRQFEQLSTFCILLNVLGREPEKRHKFLCIQSFNQVRRSGPIHYQLTAGLNSDHRGCWLHSECHQLSCIWQLGGLPQTMTCGGHSPGPSSLPFRNMAHFVCGC